MPEIGEAQVTVAAETSVGRAVGFAALAVGCVVLGLSSYPLLALRSGAALSLLTAAVLYLQALAAPRRPYKRTETWLLLNRPRHLTDVSAQQMIGGALQRILERYARWSALVALAFWLASLAWTGLAGS